MKINEHLILLDIGNNGIGNDGSKAIFEALHTEQGTSNRTLSRTKLEKLLLSNNRITAGRIVTIVTRLKRNRTLTMVDLSLNIQDKEERIEENYIRINQEIQELQQYRHKNKKQMNLSTQIEILWQ